MQALEFIRHLDDKIAGLIQVSPPMAYLTLFLIVFAETGLVIMPFLPGDTLLFAAGIFAHPEKNGFNIWLLLFLLTLAPLLGDTVNYHLGKWLGPKLFKNENSKIFKRSHLLATQEFFEKHGPKTVIIARWIPIVRTFAPFVAGMGAMEYKRFFSYSLLGAFLWVWICVWAGYLLGGIPMVKDHFELVMLIMMVITGGPVVFEAIKHRIAAKKAAAAKA